MKPSRLASDRRLPWRRKNAATRLTLASPRKKLSPL